MKTHTEQNLRLLFICIVYFITNSLWAQCPTVQKLSASSTSVCLGQSVALNCTASGGESIQWSTNLQPSSLIETTGSGDSFLIFPTVGALYFAEPVTYLSQSFPYTGAVQYFIVPAGVHSLTVDVRGAQGGNGVYGGIGGYGGRVTGTLAVKPHQVLSIYVGGAGAEGIAGYNGGGIPSGQAGGGGGASDIRLGGEDLQHRIVVAGGGGGGGQGPGGGGGFMGENGSSICSGSWATGGTQYAGGGGGLYNCGACAPGSFASDGQLGIGGSGATGTGTCEIYGGAGGGGGYFGGGGMQINGAGGGSNFLQNGVHYKSFQAGNGAIEIKVPQCPELLKESIEITVLPIPTVEVASAKICLGESYTLSPTGAESYTFQNNQNIITPLSSNTYTIIGASKEGCVSKAAAVASLEILALPLTSIKSVTLATCEGGTLNLIAEGASSYSWSSGQQSSSIVIAPLKSSQYSVIGANHAGCQSRSSVNITVLPKPVLTIETTSLQTCAGSEVKLTASGAKQFRWSTGQPASELIIKVSSDALYSVIGTDERGCSASDSIALKVINCTQLSALAKLVSDIRLFPNPSQGVFTLQVPEGIQGNIRIHTLLGQQVFNQTIKTKNTIDISGFENGLYVLILTENGQTIYSQSIIKQ